MPGPTDDYKQCEDYDQAERNVEDLLQTATTLGTVDAWRYIWAVNWPVYDHSGLGEIRRSVMEYVKEEYADVTKYLREKEDVITAGYVTDCDAILSGTYLTSGGVKSDSVAEGDGPKFREKYVLPRFLSKQQLYEFTSAEDHEEVGFGMDFIHKGAKGSLMMDTKNKADYQGDLYETTTRGFLWNRLREEQRDTATACIVLMLLAFVSLVFGCVIMGLATRELHGGKDTVVVSGILSGSVMVVCSVIGFIGALSADESWIRCNTAGALFTMIVLTTLFYIQISFILETEKSCQPSTADHTSGATHLSGDCSTKRAEISTLLVCCGISILIQFFVTYASSVLLDATNDGEKLADTLLLFRYFSYRVQGIQTKLDTRYGRAKFGDNSQLRTYNNISPAYAASRGMHLEDTKLNSLEVDGKTTPIVTH